jgi:tetratricopeptide (TPR) repeat protein
VAVRSNNWMRDILIIAGVLSVVGVVYSSVYIAGADKRPVTDMGKPLTTIDTDDPVAIVEVGNQLMDAGRYNEAISHYSRALALDSSLVDVIVDRGSCYFALDELDSAKADFEKAVAMDSTHAIANFNLGIVNGRLGNDTLMTRYWEKYLELEPTGELADQIREFLQKHKHAGDEADMGL